MKRYAEYKDSGIEWIGEIPSEWEVKPLKYFATANDDVLTEKTSPDYIFRYVDIGSVSLETGIQSYQEMQFINAPSRARRKVKKGDVIVSTVRTYLKAIAKIEDDENVIVSTGFAVVRSQAMDHRYLSYSLINNYFVETVAAYSVGVSYPAINTSVMLNIKNIIPSMSIQQSIVAYLDRKTAAIDELIVDKQKLVALLQEKRSSIISKAVTKGLDKTAKMKDSGVEWIGEIPEDFTVQKLKFFTEVKDGTHDTPEYVEMSLHSVPLITSKDIKNKQITFNNAKHISQEDHYKISKRSNVEIHNVIMPMIGTVGNPAIVMTDNAFSIKNVALFKTSDVITAKYLQYYLDSKLTQYQFDLLNRGGVQQFVSLDILNNLYIIIPEDVENMVLVLDSKTAQIDALISDINEQIEKLKEYRQAVISEAVTGKVAV